MTENDELDRIALDQESIPAIMADLYDYLGRFICYPSEEAHVAHALWCVHAHLMEHWDTTPRIAFLSAEPASGKSRALEVMHEVVPNPVLTVNTSPAYLIRKIGDEEGAATILYDEIDTVFGPKAKDNEDIRGLLNAGYKRGATSGRCVMHGKTVKTEEIPAYAAVALAGLGHLPDTILTRSVIIRMKRRKPGQTVNAFRQRIHGARGNTIRDRLLGWSLTIDRINLDATKLPPEIQDRDADVWEPLIAVADMIGGEWPELARVAAVALSAKAKEVEPSQGIKLLADMHRLFMGRDMLATADALRELAELEESPWSDINFGKPLNAQGLAKRLREYDIRPCNIRSGAAGVVKGYRKADFAEAWEMYLPAKADEAATPLQPKGPHESANAPIGELGRRTADFG
jgi:hypothetical protein